MIPSWEKPSTVLLGYPNRKMTTLGIRLAIFTRREAELLYFSRVCWPTFSSMANLQKNWTKKRASRASHQIRLCPFSSTKILKRMTPVMMKLVAPPNHTYEKMMKKLTINSRLVLRKTIISWRMDLYRISWPPIVNSRHLLLMLWKWTMVPSLREYTMLSSLRMLFLEWLPIVLEVLRLRKRMSDAFSRSFLGLSKQMLDLLRKTLLDLNCVLLYSPKVEGNKLLAGTYSSEGVGERELIAPPKLGSRNWDSMRLGPSGTFTSNCFMSCSWIWRLLIW